MFGPARTLNHGVRRLEAWSWAMLDFANSGYTTVVLTAVFSVYFVGVVAQDVSWATLAWTASLSLSYLLVMLTLPALAARADASATKKRLLFCSLAGCMLGTLMLSLTGPGSVLLAACLIVFSNYCFSASESAIASFLPELARPEAFGRVSGWGWGLGYMGGLFTLILALWLILLAESTGLTAERAIPWVMVMTALVIGLAMMPALFWLKERAKPTSAVPVNVLVALRQSWREDRHQFTQLHRLLACIACYQSGIAVVITLAAVYAKQAMGFTLTQTIILVIAVNVAASVGALSFGWIQDRIGHRAALAITLVGWLVMVVLAYLATGPDLFWVAACIAGLCMGTSQSAGRAMVGCLAPEGRLSSFYSFWTFALQLAAAIGPLCYGMVTWLTGGDHRAGMLVTGLFFVLGLVLLSRVDMTLGQAERQRAQEMSGTSKGDILR